MARPVTVSEAQGQLLETALDLYRIVYRLHRHREGLRVPFENRRPHLRRNGCRQRATYSRVGGG